MNKNHRRALSLMPKSRPRSNNQTRPMQMQPIAHHATAPSQMLPMMARAKRDEMGAADRNAQQAAKASRPKKPLARAGTLPAALAQVMRKKSLRKQREAQKP
jgi:hypothetical protein